MELLAMTRDLYGLSYQVFGCWVLGVDCIPFNNTGITVP